MIALRDRLRRDVWGPWGQTAALALLVAAVVTFVSGGYLARRMLAGARDHWVDELALADLEIYVGPTTEDLAAKARRVHGVVYAEQRFVMPARVGLPNGRTIPAVSTTWGTGGAPRLNRVELLEGRSPHPEEAALLVDRSLRRDHGVRPGDALRLEVDGESTVLPVVGVTLSPEHLLTPLHPEYAMPARGALAVVYPSRTALQAFPRVAERDDALLLRVAPGADVERVRQDVLVALDVTPLGSLTRGEQPTLRLIGVVLAVFDAYMPPVAAVLGSVGLALVALAVVRTVRRRRTEVGTLLGLGHGAGSVAASFLPVAWVPTGIGALLGALAQRPFARELCAPYERSIGWAPLVPVDPGPALALTVGACLFVATLAALVPALSATRLPPGRLLRARGAGGSGARGPGARLLARAAGALGLSTSVTLGLTNVARRAGTTAASIVGLGALFAVLIAFVVIHTTYEGETTSAAHRVGLSAVVRFAEPVGAERVEALAARAEGRAEPTLTALVQVDDARGRVAVRLVGAPTDGAWMRTQRLAEGGRLPQPGGPAELLLDRWVADERGLKVGSRMTLYPNANAPEGLEVVVVGIVEGLSGIQAYADLERVRELLAAPALANGAQVESALPPDELEARLSALPGVERVHALGNAVAEVLTGFEGGRKIVGIALAMAVALAVLFLGVTAALDGAERAPAIAVLHAVGWTDRALLSVSVTEVLARGLPALALGIAGAPHLARALLMRLSEANHFPMRADVPAWLPLTLLGAGLLALPLAALPAWRRAVNTPPLRALRTLSAE